MEKQELKQLLQETLYLASDKPLYEKNMVLVSGIAVPQFTVENRMKIASFIEELFTPFLPFLEVKKMPLFIKSEDLRGDIGAFEDGEQAFLANPKPKMVLVDLSEEFVICYLFYITEEHYDALNLERLVKHLVLKVIIDSPLDFVVSNNKVSISLPGREPFICSCNSQNGYAVLYQYAKDFKALHYAFSPTGVSAPHDSKAALRYPDYAK